MIKKIERIKNFAVFDDYKWDDITVNISKGPLTFKKLNIIYGRNYSGKTSISNLIRTLETHELPEKYDDFEFEILLDDGTKITEKDIASTNVDVRVFNKDFIRKNLKYLTDSDDEIMPFAVLGSVNAENEKSIEELNLEIGHNDEEGLRKELKDYELVKEKYDEEYKNAEDALDYKLRIKATDKSLGIKYNSGRFGDQNYDTSKIKRDIETVTAEGYKALTDDQKKQYEIIVTEQTKTEVPLISVPDFKIESFFKEASMLLSREIGTSDKISDLIRNSALNHWVSEGKDLLGGQDLCAFCGNQISEERWRVIRAHFDKESENLNAEINSLIERIESEKELVNKPSPTEKNNFYSVFHDKLDIFNKKKEAMQMYSESLDVILNKLHMRKNQITVTTVFIEPEHNVEEIQTLLKDINEIIENNNSHSNKLASERKKAQNMLRLQEVADFCTLIDYPAEKGKISALKDEKKDADLKYNTMSKLISTKKKELKNLSCKFKNEREGAKLVNRYLNDHFGHNFLSLEAEEITDDVTRVRFRILRDGKPAYNLSEGECSLIAFCYFIAKLDDADTDGKKPIIWIDDPISSLDSNHVYFMYSLIDSVIVQSDNFEQLFISTHNLDFLRYLQRLYPRKDKYKEFFFIERIGKQSRIIQMPRYLKKNATEFNYLFSIIYECSECKSVTDENYDLLYGFGNNARKFLELYLYFKYPTSENLYAKLERFFDKEKVPPILVNRALNEGSHNPSPEKSLRKEIDSETIPVAKKLIEKLGED